MASPAALVLVVLAVTILGFAASILYAERSASTIDDDAISIATDASPAIEYLAAARTEILRVQLEAGAIVERRGQGASVDRTALDENLAELRRELDAYAQLPFYPEERQRFAEADRARASLEGSLETFTSLAAANDVAGARAALRGEVSQASANLDQAIAGLIAFNAEQQHRLGVEIPILRREANRTGHIFEALTAAFGFVLTLLLVRGARRYAQLLEERRRLAEESALAATHMSGRLEHLAKASVSIADNFSRHDQLHATFVAVADEARVVVDAEFCALGFSEDAARPFEPWAFSGMSAATAAELGTPPRPVGVLGAVAREGKALRLPDVTKHPEFRGLPAHHPPLGPFLGVPLLHEGTNVGNIYFARSPGKPTFTDDDERAASLLAAFVAVTIENVRLLGDAQAATRAREDLIATVSHDLRNPLNSIRLSSDLVRRAGLEGKAAELIGRIERATNRALRLIGDLLDASKLEAGHMRVDGRPEDASSLVREAAEIFAVAAAEKSIELSWRAAPSSLAVRCERESILRVFANLIGNAIKFTPNDGTISVVAEEWNNTIRFSVKDTGPGIPAEHLPHLFDRYWQQRESDRRGTGLGLFIAKGIVEAHGGRIWVESTPGEGTTFYFALPAIEAADQPALSPQ